MALCGRFQVKSKCTQYCMYAVLLALWLLAKLWKESRELVFQLATVGIMGLAGFVYIHERAFEPAWTLPRFAFMFFTGAVYYCLRDRIELSKPAALVAVSAIMISLLRPGDFFLALNLLLPYVLFCGAYMIGAALEALIASGIILTGFTFTPSRCSSALRS